ncbi:unnamed protein product [Bursaphelenchus xylophilus]|uniref:(pine wood nematode) hypothetical protein n=1 Tax=Bursaphelenchus xylophilus TaxID=6326 RepID=A0A1I7RQ90_BURXY|nr:unnamed protein product [Bursaphelenchus xylophilus]CAG9097330.1 unnamed protein product [Bursaphelenchus xylophilus]
MVIRRKARTRLQAGEKEKKFKFLSFADHIAKISVDYASSSLALPNGLNERHTFFFETVTKWIDLDYGDDFKDFLAEINHEELATYSQILHHQDRIADAIQKHLRIRNSSALCAILEISIGFARDLREDFEKHFWNFFDTIVFLIECRIQNVEVIESCFRSLTVFFKLQWRKIVPTLRRTLARLFPLLSYKQEFVRRFIAEAASFLLRKSANVQKIVKFIIEKSANQEDEYIADGIVQLLFNSIKGTKGFFHSQASVLLNQFLDAIYSLDQDSKDFGVQVMEGVMVECVHHADKPNFKDISDTLLTRISKDAENSRSYLDNDLRLVRIILLEKNGYMFTDFERALKLLEGILDGSSASEIFYDVAGIVISTYYTNFKSKDSILRFFEKTVNMTTSDNINWLFSFYRRLVDLSVFDLWAMESVGKLGNELMKNDVTNLEKFLDFYVDIILHKNQISFNQNYTINKFFDPTGHKSFRNLLIKTLENKEISEEMSLKCIIAIPYVLVGNEYDDVAKLLLSPLKSTIKQAKDQCTLKAYLGLYVIRLLNIKEKFVSLNDILEYLKHARDDEVKLRIVDLVVHSFDTSELTVDSFNIALGSLEKTVGNPNSNIRHLALRILKFFSYSLEDITITNLFDSMIQVECQPLTFENHRERASFLSRVKTALLALNAKVDYKERLQQITIRFTIAQLFEKLTLYWPLVNDIAKTMGEVVSTDALWVAFSEFIEVSNKFIRGGENEKIIGMSTDLINKIMHSEGSRVDYWSFRLEVLKLLGRFMELAERKNRSLVPLLLDIYHNEFQSVTVTTKLWDDITIQKGKEIEVEQGEDDEIEIAAEESSIAKKLDRKLVTNTIRQILVIFAKFSNLKQVYKSAELYDVINDLLRSDHSDVQKYAVECLFSYKIKELDPYKENFENLVADKQFSDELVHFSVDEHSTVVVNEHRDTVLPILMRVLDGKMHSKAGRRGVSKRPAIFRFVAGCRPEELELFLKTVFWTINDLVDEGNLNKACDQLIKTYNPHKTVALQRISR